jgi:hypothetical protein
MIGSPEELKLSERVTVKVAELDGWETDRADLILAEVIGKVDAEKRSPISEMMLLSSKVHALCSVREINGAPVTPLKNIAEYVRAAKLLNARERNKLSDWAQPLYSPTPEKVGNEQAPEPSEL